MTGAEAERVNAQLRALSQSYADQLGGRIATLREVWRRLENDASDEEALRLLYFVAHSLAGSGAAFGFDGVSAAARALCISLAAIMERARPLTGEDSSALRPLLEWVRSAAVETPRLPVVPACDRRSLTHERRRKRILLVEDDALVARDMELQLGHFGYEVDVDEDGRGFLERASATRPAAIIMDIVLPSVTGTDLIRNLRETDSSTPILVMSSRDDSEARLKAVRAGADGYFVKPVDVAAIVDRLDVLTGTVVTAPYRVLVVDDEPLLCEQYRIALELAGIGVRTASDPLRCLPILAEYRPDVILMDVHMPGCSGAELATAIRHQEQYASVPIVFLSVESDRQRQMAALRAGGDEFLTKPVRRDELVAMVTLRAERSRTLHALIGRDGSTGLWNHRSLKSHLEIEIARAARERGRLAFAMIDVDHFKGVNDAHGHPAGDQLLMTLARMLRQRLRRGDVVGRYGGDELGAVLPGADAAAAVAILEPIRVGFSELSLSIPTGLLRATLSCGVSCYPASPDATSLIQAADDALYRAKAAGRNRIVGPVDGA